MNPKKFLTEVQINAGLKKITLDAGGEPWALIGGLAMQYYGSPRLTVDLDVVVPRIPPAVAGQPGRPLRFHEMAGGKSVTDPQTQVVIDWLDRSDEFAALYQEALLHAKDSGEGYRVVTPEYLLAMKMEAKRQKDEDDLLWLLQQPDLVDRSVAKGIVRKFFGAYGVSDFESYVLEADWRKARDPVE